MKKNITKTIALVSALLVTGVGSAAKMNKAEIDRRCHEISYTLSGMYEEHPRANCADDVQYVGWVMHDAGDLVREERYLSALKKLRIADGHLSWIHSESQECAYFSPKVKPSMYAVKALIAALEDIPNGLGKDVVSLKN